MPPQWRSLAFGARHRRRLVRTVPVLAARGRADRQLRLAAHAADLRGDRAADHAALARAGDAARRPTRAGSRRRAAIGHAGAGEALRSSELRAAGARLLHLRLPDLLHHRAPAGLSGRPRSVGRDRRLDARRDRPVQHRRLDHRRLALRPHAQALHPVVHLFRALARDPRLHHAAAERGRDLDLRRRDGPALALDGAADLRAGRR